MMEFHILTIGHFSRNRFWGESDDRSYRDALCTSTLIRGGENIVVDPSLPPEEMAKVLYDRSGLRPRDVSAVFITHAHGDHYMGLELFDQARWYMGPVDLAAMKNSTNEKICKLAETIQAVDSGCLEGIKTLPLPGHTPGMTGLAFDSVDGRVVVAGDTVMNRDFFRHRLGYYNAVDQEQNRQSILRIAEMADIVIPGHDNYFIAKN
jgi:glyoxylase-like metal-dependent hydrolase (beta-lactamase superfamily II)